jgi:SAM-dependent methyltransferase
MHQSSFEKMAEFLDRYYSNDGIVRTVLDFGSKDVNGTYRSLFPPENWKYLGLDLEEGENVNLVPKDPYRWNEVKNGTMDLVISGQALEHIEFPWKIFETIKRILKPNGLCCVIAPSAGPEHKHPVDCWRFYPDGMKSLCKHAGLECLEANTDWNPKKYKDGSALWKDTLLLARKPEPKPIPRIKAKAPKKFSPRYESEITSWHPHREFAYDLMAELKPKLLVELGVHCGDSYFTFCQAREEHELETLCYGVDHWKGDEQSGLYGEEVFDEANEYNAEFYSDFSNLMRMDFNEALKEFEDGSINLLHIDGSHDYESISGHFESWLPKIKRNGVILIHDINVKREDFGVEKFWGKLKSKYFTKTHEVGHGLGIVLIGNS